MERMILYGVSLVIIAGLVLCVLYWTLKSHCLHMAAMERAWNYAIKAQNEAWSRMVEERKVHRDEISVMSQWVCEMAKQCSQEERVFKERLITHVLDKVKEEVATSTIRTLSDYGKVVKGGE